MWARLRDAAVRSLTMGWATMLGVGGLLLDNADAIFGDDIKQQIQQGLADHPWLLGKIVVAIAIVTALARLRGLWKRAQ